MNSGTPIPPEHLSGIFEEYTSYAGGSDRSGGGLGLAICRKIIGDHEGKVWAENSISGPMISFVIPLRPEASRAPKRSTGDMTLAEAG
jgi:signal transduction histidine kinase